jgi:CDP-4-dehydro-6-deoxyglucose reductase
VARWDGNINLEVGLGLVLILLNKLNYFLIMAITWFESEVERIENLTAHVRQFTLRSHGVEFKAGQFITLDLPIGEKRIQRWRSYSIASAPSDGDALELCIVRSASGEGTRYLFEEVREGSILRWKGPEGAFVLSEEGGKELVMVCTGTGIAPFRSMLREIRAKGLSYKSVHLIFGARGEEDILYREEMEDLARAWPSFRYDIVLSRSPDWEGYSGHVHQVYQECYSDVRSEVLFLLCGWTGMVDQAVENIVCMGYDRSQVRLELYG